MATEPAPHIVIQVRLPHRPGALGAVAARIGAIGANITDVKVAVAPDPDHPVAPDSAIDEFHIDLPESHDVSIIEVLRAELHEVDGAGLESWHEANGCCDR